AATVGAQGGTKLWRLDRMNNNWSAMTVPSGFEGARLLDQSSEGFVLELKDRKTFEIMNFERSPNSLLTRTAR
ncbi:MAG TPA: hypothetical protein VGL53_11400, partial [Bryobacteraceae bacterium]